MVNMFENTRVSEASRVSLSIGQTFGHLYIEYVLEIPYIVACIALVGEGLRNFSPRSKY